MTELGVQETNLCQSQRKGKVDVSAIVAFCSSCILPVFEELCKEYDDRQKSANQYLSGSKDKVNCMIWHPRARENTEKVPRK